MDPQLRGVVATTIGSRLRALLSKYTSIDARETAFAMATLQAGDALVSQQERTTPGCGWSGDAQTEAELSRAFAVRCTAWLQLESDNRSSQLRREVRRASKEKPLPRPISREVRRGARTEGLEA